MAEWSDGRLDEFALRIDERFDRIEEKFDGKFERVDEKFTEINGRLDRLDGRVESLRQSMVIGVIAMCTMTFAGFGALITLFALHF
jgi:hypothetical protein